jgi:eukaryotic-like serine/threonine-protein kinase
VNTDRWQQVEEIFNSAVERNAEERKAFLVDACSGDEALIKEVESLLRSDDEATYFLNRPAADRYKTIFPDERISDQRIGPYRIIREIGYGGMGAVYLAARDDDQYHKEVAIKLVRPGVHRDLRIQRFHTERQILANLDHPNIAKLLDGGTTEEGIPYLVMDYVEGVPIDDYCDSKKLSIVQRLQLFQTICSAVQYAHQNLVVHRDIKPSNILVNEEGVPKLLDFGIAKLLHYDADTKPLTTSLLPMTPEYASPEQIRGERITTASDVYSLGVLLYGLLTGHPPYHFKSRLPSEMLRIICEQEPEKPSLIILQTLSGADTDGNEQTLITPELVSETREGSPEKLQRRLSGDLDNIVLMALRKDPQRRYASAQQLSEDIRRYLHSLPVQARKDTLVYRSKKFILRHKMGVTAASLVVLILIAGIFSVAWQANIAAQQRDKARMEAEKAKQINSFVRSMLGSADPSMQGRNVTVAHVLNEATKRVDTELANQPEIQTAVLSTIGHTYFGLGLYDAAEKHFRKSLDGTLKQYGRNHPESAIAMNDLGLVLVKKGNLKEAEPLFHDSLEILRKTYGQKHTEIANVLNNLAELYLSKGDLSKAESVHYEELAIRRSLLGNNDPDVAVSLNDLAVVLGTKGDYDTAEKLHREALSILRKTKGNYFPDVASTLNNIAVILETKKEYSKAEPLFQEALAIRRKLLGNEHPEVAWTLYNYAYLMQQKGDSDQAIKLSEEVLSMRKKSLADEHPIVAATLHLLGLSFIHTGKAAKALPVLKESLELRRRTLSSDHWLVSNSEAALGNCLTHLNQYTEAEKLLLKGYANLKNKLGDDHEKTQLVLQWIVEMYEDWGKPNAAKSYKNRLKRSH